MSAASYFPLHHLIKISIPECLEKWVIRLKLGIKIYFPRRLKNWLGVFYNFLPSLICLVLPLPLLVISSTLALWKNRTATARRKQLCDSCATWKFKLSAYFFVFLTVKNGEHSLYRLCQSLSHEGLMTKSWFGPFCKTNLLSTRKKAYIYLLILYNAQVFSLKWYRKCIFLETPGSHWNQELILAPDHNFSHSVAPISNETLIQTWSI